MVTTRSQTRLGAAFGAGEQLVDDDEAISISSDLELLSVAPCKPNPSFSIDEAARDSVRQNFLRAAPPCLPLPPKPSVVETSRARRLRPKRRAAGLSRLVADVIKENSLAVPQLQPHREVTSSRVTGGGANGSFGGDIIIRNKADALAYADRIYEEVERGTRIEDLVIWTDGSVKRAEPAGVGVAFKTSPGTPEWTELLFGIYGHVNKINHIELIGIEEAIKAVNRTPQPRWKMVMIFTDSVCALHHVRQVKAKTANGISQTVESVFSETRLLRRTGLSIQLHWVPGHRSPGNNKADRLARAARLIAGSLPRPLPEGQGLLVEKLDVRIPPSLGSERGPKNGPKTGKTARQISRRERARQQERLKAKPAVVDLTQDSDGSSDNDGAEETGNDDGWKDVNNDDDEALADHEAPGDRDDMDMSDEVIFDRIVIDLTDDA